MSISAAMYNGVSGLNSFSTALEVTSDNIANTGTSAFKSNSVRFGDMVSSYYSTQSQDTDRRGAGSVVLGIATDLSQGSNITTTNWSDLSINGEGYFNVAQIDNTGALTGKTCYTRDGSFYVDQNGYMVNYQGYALLDTAGAPIRVEADPANPAYMNYTVDKNGQVWGTPVDPTVGTDPVTIGSPIKVSIFPNAQGLIRQGSNLYLAGPESKTPADGQANQSPRGSISGFSIEGSNVDLAKEMVNMIVYQASYNANTKSITTGRDMLDTTINMVR